ncbi:hypothetical protein KP509_1Z047200 [Ceratopteris richardii]|nr:hypothetical protein KP509_1Z047200 [Ceratopteris richardii]
MTGASITAQACAACKFQRRKCSPDCPLAPYFPAEQPKQFLNVHKLYGVSNTLRILKQVDPLKRNDAMKSILYEANARDRDPVHGCFGIIVFLQNQADMLREELAYVRAQIHVLEQQVFSYYNQHQNQANPYPSQVKSLSVSSPENLTPWSPQVITSAPTSPTSGANLLYQYVANSLQMQAQMDACTNDLSPTSYSAGLASNRIGILDVDSGFDTRPLVDFDAPQHSFHDSAPKAETYESSGESSIKDPHSLEQDELESAAALFTLTSGQST